MDLASVQRKRLIKSILGVFAPQANIRCEPTHSRFHPVKTIQQVVSQLGVDIVLTIPLVEINSTLMKSTKWKITFQRGKKNPGRKFVENEKYLCISGEISSIKTDSNGRRRWVWIFDRYKTKKGCDSYFEGECDLKKIIANGQCEN